MPTTAQRFRFHTDDWDGTDPIGGDVRKLVIGANAADNSSIVNFPNAAAERRVDPFTEQAAGVGGADFEKFGWAVNYLGADGMESTASAVRRVPSGTWAFRLRLNLLSAATATEFRARMRVYRVSADGATRTLLFTIDTAQAVPLGLGGSNYAGSASQSEIVVEAGETLQVSFTIEKMAGNVMDERIELRLSDGGNNFVDVASPGVLTRFFETITATAVCTPTVTDGTKLVTGIVYDSTGEPVTGATVKLFDQTTDEKISERASGADGTYTFTRTDIDTATYYVVGFSGDTLHGTSDRGLQAT